MIVICLVIALVAFKYCANYKNLTNESVLNKAAKAFYEEKEAGPKCIVRIVTDEHTVNIETANIASATEYVSFITKCNGFVLVYRKYIPLTHIRYLELIPEEA